MSSAESFESTVHVPNIEKNCIESQRENIVVIIDNNQNEEDSVSETEDVLEINAEDESLEDL